LQFLETLLAFGGKSSPGDGIFPDPSFLESHLASHDSKKLAVSVVDEAIGAIAPSPQMLPRKQVFWPASWSMGVRYSASQFCKLALIPQPLLPKREKGGRIQSPLSRSGRGI